MSHINSNEDFTIIKQKIMNIIKQHNGQNNIVLPPESIHNLATHLTITLMRLQTANYIPLSNSRVASIPEDENYAYAAMICKDIATFFQESFPPEEIAIASMYISQSNALDIEIKSGFDLLDKDIFYLIKYAMSDIYQSYQYDFRENDALWIAIGLHLTPAIDRLKEQTMLTNPLTASIKAEHPLAFSFANTINNQIKKQYHTSFSDDELAFIAMHFLNVISEPTQ